MNLERIVLLMAVFLMGYIFLITPLPNILLIDMVGIIGTALEYLISLAGFIMMVLSAISLLKLMLKK
ncbi:hypothetical protein [Paenibacillus prosopidis]|uniref:Uncharacterized protein n=1 Tax=Paenibacillus prosopidis TaxID=630520 RepID=A0A368VP00_9BACL|nr:hypothetical protein [Paenibacillus prosopidis]RCW41520.1 hypothetical protein DFP97_12349 [Paenibacillus prosopidis]